MNIKTIENHTLIDSSLVENSNIIDLGLNQGDFAQYFLSKGCNVFGLEPTKSLIKNCLEKIKNLKFINAAAGISNDKEIEFYEDSNNNQSSSIYNNYVMNKSHSYKIPIFNLENIIELSKYEIIDLIKIDIEGAEIELLKKFNIENYYQRISQITVEFHDFLDIKQVHDINLIFKKYSKFYYIKKMTFSNHSDVIFLNKDNFNIKFYNILNFYFLKIKRPIAWRLKKIFKF